MKVILGFWSFDHGNVAAFGQDFTILNTNEGAKTTGPCSTYGITTATTCTLLYGASGGILELDGPMSSLTFAVSIREVTFGWTVSCIRSFILLFALLQSYAGWCC